MNTLRCCRRWEAQQLTHHQAEDDLQAVFLAHHERILAHEKGVTRMVVAGFLCVLHECALLDNATAPTDADNIFTTVAAQQQPYLHNSNYTNNKHGNNDSNNKSKAGYQKSQDNHQQVGRCW
jgi:hypothetical protein